MATTPLMSLSLPSPSSTAGPSWASQLNAALAVVDSHTHVAGSGARVPSAGLNINAALAFNGFDATTLRSVRMTNQVAALALGTDVGCLYVAGGDLYFNSSAGQQVKVTSGAGLNAGSIGGFSGDFGTSTAAATYTAASTTFAFTSAANKYANLDAGNLVLREAGATSPNGVTIKSPASLAASYALTLPAALPAATKILTLSSAGAVAAAYDVDGATLEVAANVLRVKDGGLTNAKQSFGTPSAGTDVAIKSYVDSRFIVAGRVNGSTGTMVAQSGSVTASIVRNSAGNYTVTVPGLTANGTVLVSMLNFYGNAPSVRATVGSGSFVVDTAFLVAGAQTATDGWFSFAVLSL